MKDEKKTRFKMIASNESDTDPDDTCLFLLATFELHLL